jgi:DNA-binding transcriptional regulator/RsmH inhibitor MraZ
MVQLDKEGRFVLPSLVTQALEIKEMITFVGRRSVFQMWHPAAYEAHRDRNRVRRLERYASNAGGNA